MRYLCSLTMLLLLGAASPSSIHAAEAPGGVVIHEIELGASAWIEVHNGGEGIADLTGWQLHLFDGAGWSEVYTFPVFFLVGGGYVVVEEGGSSADDTALELHTGWAIPWSNAGTGAAELLSASLAPADYVEFGQGVPVEPVHDGSWSGSYGAVVPEVGKTLAREPGLADSDGFGDWCGQEATPGAANEECTCSAMYLGLPIVTTTLYGTWGPDDPNHFEACDTFYLTFADPSAFEEPPPPFSLEPGVTFTVRAGKAVIFNSGTWIPNGATLKIEIDPQLRQ